MGLNRWFKRLTQPEIKEPVDFYSDSTAEVRSVEKRVQELEKDRALDIELQKELLVFDYEGKRKLRRDTVCIVARAFGDPGVEIQSVASTPEQVIDVYLRYNEARLRVGKRPADLLIPSVYSSYGKFIRNYFVKSGVDYCREVTATSSKDWDMFGYYKGYRVDGVSLWNYYKALKNDSEIIRKLALVKEEE